jgi:dTMP kinase
MKNKGFFIAVDGCDAAGKSSAMALMKEFFVKEKGFKESDVVLTREPGGTFVGEEIRSLLLDPDTRKNKMDMKTEMILMYASRNQLLKEVIEPALKAGKVVITDRWESSTFAYQTVRGADPKEIKQMSDFVCTTQPDLMIILDVTPEKTLERIANKRDGKMDRTESTDSKYFESIRNSYLEYAKENKSTVIDASVELNDMLFSIYQKLYENTNHIKKKVNNARFSLN